MQSFLSSVSKRFRTCPLPLRSSSCRSISSLNSAYINSVRNNPDAIAMAHDDHIVTYAELDQNVNKLCAKLLNEYNLQKGDKVLHMSDVRIDCTQIMLACSKLGLVHVPTYPELTQKQFESISRTCDPSLIISENSYLSNVFDCGLQDKLVVLDDVFDPKCWLGQEQSESDANAIDQIATETTDDSDIFAIFFTSGTTGDPKGCVHTHGSTLCNVAWPVEHEHAVAESGQRPPFQRPEVMLSLIPQHGIASPWWRLSALMAGNTVLLPNKHKFRDARHWVDLMTGDWKDKTFECVFFGKAMSDLFIDHRAGRIPVMPNLTWFLYGGDFVPLEIVSYLTKNVFVNARVTMGWGMTEIGVVSLSDPFLSYDKDKISVPLGRFGSDPSDFISDIKLDEESGEILFKQCKHGMTEYYKNETKTKELRDENGWVRTGDVGRVENDILYITGRKKDVIMLQEDTRIICPSDIESSILANEEMIRYINDIAVVGCPNDLLRSDKDETKFGLLGESPVAVVTLKPQYKEIKNQVVTKIYQLCEAKLPPIMHLKHVFIVDEMPKGATNKLSKTTLKEKIVSREYKIEKEELLK